MNQAISLCVPNFETLKKLVVVSRMSRERRERRESSQLREGTLSHPGNVAVLRIVSVQLLYYPRTATYIAIMVDMACSTGQIVVIRCNQIKLYMDIRCGRYHCVLLVSPGCCKTDLLYLRRFLSRNSSHHLPVRWFSEKAHFPNVDSLPFLHPQQSYLVHSCSRTPSQHQAGIIVPRNDLWQWEPSTRQGSGVKWQKKNLGMSRPQPATPQGD